MRKRFTFSRAEKLTFEASFPVFRLHVSSSSVPSFVQSMVGFPLGLENLEKWEGNFQSGNFEQIGKVGYNHTKYCKNQGISDKSYLLLFSDI